MTYKNTFLFKNNFQEGGSRVTDAHQGGHTKTTQRYTHVSKRTLKRIESPIDRILRNQNNNNHHIINK